MTGKNVKPGTGDAVAGTPTIPIQRNAPPSEWEHGELYIRVIDAFYALPDLFKTALNIAGVRATDLYTLNSTLGASIEQSVVDNLNALRSIWDPNGRYKLYSFVRQPQVFPDVRLQTSSPNENPSILMGIELKGWFALSKEGEPSFRYKVTPSACAEQDLLVVFPWILDEVVSGAPKFLSPFVAEARYAAEHRNHYWTILRGVTGADAEVILATHQQPYPRKGARFNDEARKDGGKNFGRVARGGIMKGFIIDLMKQPVAGIPLGAWQNFLCIFSDGVLDTNVQKELNQIGSAFSEHINRTPESRAAFDQFVESVRRLIAALDRQE